MNITPHSCQGHIPDLNPTSKPNPALLQNIPTR